MEVLDFKPHTAVLLLRITVGILVFSISVQVGVASLLSLSFSMSFWLWVLFGIPLIIGQAIFALKNTRGARVFNMFAGAFMGFSTFILILVVAHAIMKYPSDIDYWLKRAFVPFLFIELLLHLLSFLFAYSVWINPVPERPPPSFYTPLYVFEEAADMHEVEIADDEEALMEDVEDGLGLRDDSGPPSPATSPPPPPSGIYHWYPTLMVVFNVLNWFTWPYFVLETLVVQLAGIHGTPPHPLHVAVVITYSVATFIWLSGTLAVSIQHKNKSAVYAGALVSVVYWIFTLPLLFWEFSKIVAIIHFVLIIPWIVCAWMHSHSPYDGSKLESCCC